MGPPLESETSPQATCEWQCRMKASEALLFKKMRLSTFRRSESCDGNQGFNALYEFNFDPKIICKRSRVAKKQVLLCVLLIKNGVF